MMDGKFTVGWKSRLMKGWMNGMAINLPTDRAYLMGRGLL